MAKLHIVVSRTNARADSGETLPIPDAIPLQAATVATGAVSAVVATMPSGGTLACHMTAIGGPVWIAFGLEDGAAPVAGEGNGWLVQEGEARSFGVATGQRLAAMDAVL